MGQGQCEVLFVVERVAEPLRKVRKATLIAQGLASTLLWT